MPLNNNMIGNVNFRIQLLSGKHVVMVEAEGYESEIFMPHIVNGRITFLNVIPNRRCCVIKAPSKMDHRVTMAVKSEQLSPPCKSSRISAGRDKENKLVLTSPLAMSTPSCPAKTITSHVRVKSGASTTCSMEGANSLPSPDLPRRDPGKRQDVAMDIAAFNLPQGLKVMRMNSSSPDGTASKTSPPKRGDQNTNNSSLSSSGVQDLSINFKANSIPLMYNSYPNEIVASTPVQKRDENSQTNLHSGKWRKVRTPKKTYSRRGDHKIPKHDKSLTSTVRNIKSSYLVNPTAGPKSAYTVEVKKRVIKVDDKTKIPSKVIKKRHLLNDKMSGSLTNTEQLHRSIKHIGKQNVSAFDLLTNSNRAMRISEKLNQQFRKGCLNKASSTYSKYKALSTVPLLKEDDQILDITGKPKPVSMSDKPGLHKANTGLSTTISRATSTTLSVPVHKKAMPGDNANVNGNDVAKAFVKPKLSSPKTVTTKRSGKVKKPNHKEQYNTAFAQRLGFSKIISQQQ